MADEPVSRTAGAAAGEQAGKQRDEQSSGTGTSAEASQRQPPDLKEQRGGEQTDQISGETQKGAHNQEMKGRNPQGNPPDRNQSSRQEGNEF
ncbi:MAG: hypothetical protein M3371_03510 [Acidobacteriota bacterium]|nr:hypothetical protein [Acidobacteriota bacterium]